MATVRALPWARILLIGRIVVERLSEDIPPKDRRRLTQLLRKSKGDPRKLSSAERRELLAIVQKVDAKKLSRAIAAGLGSARLLRR